MTQVLRYAAFDADGVGGNPAGVVLDARGIGAAERLAIAAEIGFSETAFLEPTEDPAVWTARYWSPRAEVPFCGHATVAAAVALSDQGAPSRLLLRTLSGEVGVAADRTTATLTSVATCSVPAQDQDVREALAALRWATADLDPTYPAHVAYAGAHHLVLVTATRQRLARLDYDFPRLAALMAARGWTTLQLVHPGTSGTPQLWHSRNPFPPGGVVEDPATGAAALALGGYLRVLGRIGGSTRLEIRQGEDLGQPSRLLLSVDPDDSRVRVTGTARRLDRP